MLITVVGAKLLEIQHPRPQALHLLVLLYFASSCRYKKEQLRLPAGRAAALVTGRGCRCLRDTCYHCAFCVLLFVIHMLKHFD